MSGWNATLYESVLRGNTPMYAITDRIKRTWRRSIRAVGGYWLGTCEYEGTQSELLEMFVDCLGREVREDSGGATTWRGYIAEMELTLNGVTWSRSITDCVNASKCIYTLLYDNLLTNGGSESGAWAAVNGATVTQATDWVNAGTYSGKVVVADNARRGARIGTVSITAGIEYTITGILHITSGTWKVVVTRADNDATLDQGVEHDTAGDVNIDITIPTSNTYTGNVYLDIISPKVPGGGTCHGDSFNFCRAPVSGTQTGWYTDDNSILAFGRLELADLLVGMTSDAANSKAQTTLRKRAWPNPKRPNDLTSFDIEMLGSGRDKLTMTVLGYVHTLANRYCLTPGVTAASSDQVTTIVGESEFIDVGSVAANANPFLIDPRAPIRHWQALQDIILAGDGTETGLPWNGGVYADLSFDYGPVSNIVAYSFYRGKYYNMSGGELEPWLALPGELLFLSEVPGWPGHLSLHGEDDPQFAYITEIEMGPATAEQPLGVLTMRTEVT